MEFMEQGRSGTWFAEWLVDGWPDALPALRVIGSDQDPVMEPVEAIMALAKSIPVVWAQIKSVPGKEERLREFLAELIVYSPPAQEEEEPQA